MSTEPFLGEIKIFGFNFAPIGYALCNGQTLPISQNTALFSLLGTFYGGNGVNTFQLPNLQGRVPLGMGQGPGLNPRQMGEVAGSETVTLNNAQLPAHSHTLNINNDTASIVASGNGAFLTAKTESGESLASSALGTAAVANSATVNPAGSNVPVGIMQPYLGINYSIAIQGIYPSRP